MRGPLRHYVHGKVMSWVALDRAAALFGRAQRRIDLREAIRRDILAHGLHPEGRYFVQAYGERQFDAALLLLPMLNFPADRAALERTVNAVQRQLGRGDFVKRYEGGDGFEGDEGAFLICSFWLVDALLWLGREQEARALYERLLGCANDVGLYAEEVDPQTGAFLGNFPQAFTHLALIGSAINFQLFERGGRDLLIGSYADRARYCVEAGASQWL